MNIFSSCRRVQCRECLQVGDLCYWVPRCKGSDEEKMKEIFLCEYDLLGLIEWIKLSLVFLFELVDELAVSGLEKFHDEFFKSLLLQFGLSPLSLDTEYPRDNEVASRL